MAQPVEKTKQSFFAPKTDDKYKVLQRPIGVDVDTSRITTRVIEPSSGINSTTVGSVTHVLGKKIDFDFAVSPGTLIDWDNSCLECEMHLANAAGTSVPSPVNNVIPWNALLYMFAEVHLQINGTNVFDKVGDEYCPTQTTKFLVEKTREELEASAAVFGPLFDDYYNTGVTAPSYVIDDNVIISTFGTAGEVILGGGASWKRNLHNAPPAYTDRIKKFPSLKDLFFSIPGLSNNLRNVKISLVVKSSIPLAKHNVNGDGYVFPRNFRVHLHEVQPSPNSTVVSLQNKLAAADEHIAFVDVESRMLTYSANMVVNNQQNVQYIAVAQFGGEFTNSDGTTTASLSNPGQLQLFNGYSSAAVAAGTVLYRSDEAAATACLAPPTSIQVQYGSDIYPSNAIELRHSSSTSVLQHAELYREFLRTVGKLSPSIKEHEFKRTMPMFLVKTHPSPKLMQSADIIVRMPGFNISTNTGTQYVRVLWGKLKTFNVAPSGVVSEAISTF